MHHNQAASSSIDDVDISRRVDCKSLRRDECRATRREAGTGRSGQLLLAVTADPSERTAFVSGEYAFKRVEISRQRLAAWLERPDWKGFKDF